MSAACKFIRTGKIFFDLDGPIRDLQRAIFGRNAITWNEKIDGKNLVDYVEAHKEILFSAPPTPYYNVIKELPYLNIITCQPESWRPMTLAWIYKYFHPWDTQVYFVDHAEEKLEMIGDGILFEDYPFFSNYRQIALIEYPYNKHVTGELVRILTADEMRGFLEDIR